MARINFGVSELRRCSSTGVGDTTINSDIKSLHRMKSVEKMGMPLVVIAKVQPLSSLPLTEYDVIPGTDPSHLF